MKFYNVMSPFLLAAIWITICDSTIPGKQPTRKAKSFRKKNIGTAELSIVKTRSKKQLLRVASMTSNTEKTLNTTKSSFCKTDKGELCIFPFKYQGIRYSGCTTTGNGGIYWCPTEVDRYGKYDGKYGNCGSTCTKGCRKDGDCPKGKSCNRMYDFCYGSACSPNPCMNNGVCKTDYSGEWIGCECQKNYFGYQCEYQECVDIEPKTYCNLRKDMRRCMSYADFDPCRHTCGCDTCWPNPCKNNGTCETHKSGWIECHCKDSYVGYRCEYKDAYIEVDGSHCLRTMQGYVARDGTLGDLTFDIGRAFDECSENRRCVGIEHIRTSGPKKSFVACLDSIYTSTASDKYNGLTNQLLKKVSSYVFPQDFLNPENGAHVKKNKNKTEKAFFP